MKILITSILAVMLATAGARAESLSESQTRDYTISPKNGLAVTPSDSANLPAIAKYIYIGGTGTLKVDLEATGTVTLAGLPAGTMLKLSVKKIYTTGTTATNIVEFF